MIENGGASSKRPAFDDSALLWPFCLERFLMTAGKTGISKHGMDSIGHHVITDPESKIMKK